MQNADLHQKTICLRVRPLSLTLNSNSKTDNYYIRGQMVHDVLGADLGEERNLKLTKKCFWIGCLWAFQIKIKHRVSNMVDFSPPVWTDQTAPTAKSMRPNAGDDESMSSMSRRMHAKALTLDEWESSVRARARSMKVNSTLIGLI